MGILTGLLKSGGVVEKVTDIVSKSVTDKDKRNELIYNISLLMMQSKIAPYVRAAIGLTVVVAIMFFGDRITLDADNQKYALYSVLSYYFLDRVFNSFGGSKKK